jgi:hypothetical protein
MMKKLRNQLYAPKWEQEEKKKLSEANIIISHHQHLWNFESKNV